MSIWESDERLRKLVLTDPLAYACYHGTKSNGWSDTESLIRYITGLSARVRVLEAEVERLYLLCPPQPIGETR